MKRVSLFFRAFFLIFCISSSLGIYAQTSSGLQGSGNHLNSVTFSFSNSELPYNKKLDSAATVSTVGSLALPALLMLESREAAWKAPLFYSAAVGTSFVLKEILKASFGHPRPLPYRNFYRGTDRELNDSFPSGHTALSMTAAAFTAIVYATAYPDSNYRFPVTGSVSLLAVSSGGLRIISGAHHPEDVVFGTIIGVAVGGIFGLLYQL
ncbi:MAG: phosphatase PAP2 family protein [Spirochaetales bacterium]|jgi:membrane-associated phospholipid phosphatase|nr:phosphatase PAP2 family protein [Spirochaetales bacterium]